MVTTTSTRIKRALRRAARSPWLDLAFFVFVIIAILMGGSLSDWLAYS